MKTPRLLAAAVILFSIGGVLRAADAPASSGQSKLITMHLKAAPAADAIAELQEQSGIRIDLGQQAKPRVNSSRVNVDADGQSFWKVLADIIDPLNLRPQEFKTDPPSLTLTNFSPSWKPPFFVVSGPVAIALRHIQRTSAINYGSDDPPAGDHCQLSFDIFPEPWMKVTQVVAINVTRCVDDTGFPIAAAPISFQTSSYFPLPTNESIQLTPQGGKAIAELEGSVVLRTSAGTKHLDIADPTQIHGVELPIGEAGARIDSCVKDNPRQYVLKVTLRHGPNGRKASDTTFQSLLNSHPRLLDSTGHEFNALRFHGQEEESGDITIPFTMIAGGGSMPSPVTQLVWDIPQGVQDLAYPFAFHNVPLPKTIAPSLLASAAPTTRPALPAATADAVDYPKRVNEMIKLLASTSSQDRMSGRIGLAMLPPAALPALETAVKRRDIPPAASGQLNAMTVKQRSWQKAGAKHDAWITEMNSSLEKLALDSYARIGQRNSRWDQQAVDAIHLNYTATDRIDLRRVRSAFEDALAAGCEDPLVLSLAAYNFEHSGADVPTLFNLFSRGRDGMARLRYPAVFRIWNSIHYESVRLTVASFEAFDEKSQFLKDEDARICAQLRGDLLTLWPQAVHDGLHPQAVEALAHRILGIHENADDDVDRAYKSLVAPLEAVKFSDAALLRLKGAYLVAAGWKSRGGGTIDTVTDKGYADFRDKMIQAERALVQATKLDPTNPDAPAALIYVCLGSQQDRGPMENWFNKAVAIDPGNAEAYSNKLFYLTPRWYGSVPEMKQVGQQFAATENWRAGLPFYEATYHLNAVFQAQQAEYLSQETVFQDFKRVYEGYLRAMPDDVQARSEYCVVACKAGRWDIAKEQFRLLGPYAPIREFQYPAQIKRWRDKADAAGGNGKL